MATLKLFVMHYLKSLILQIFQKIVVRVFYWTGRGSVKAVLESTFFHGEISSHCHYIRVKNCCAIETPKSHSNKLHIAWWFLSEDPT